MKKIIRIILLLGTIAFFVGMYFYEINSNPNIDTSSKYYVNHIYMSDGRIYENYLSKDEQKIYDLFMDVSKKRLHRYESSLKELKCPDGPKQCFSMFQTVSDAIIVDHPELISFSGWGAEYEKPVMTLRFYYATPFRIIDFYGEARINMIVNEIKRDTEKMTDEEKIIYVYNWIGERATYDYTFTYSDKNQSAYNVMIKRNAVCAGFAKTANIIFQAIGIESYGITGHSHMWNVVKLNGKYYYFDSTVAACRKKGSQGYYDGLIQSTMNDYAVDHEDWYPEIETSDMKLDLKVK